MQTDTFSPTAVAVRVNLSCGWCAQQIFAVPGRMATTAGRLHLAPTDASIRVVSGRPVCPRCGGPLFVDDWKVTRAPRSIEPQTFEADDGEAPVAA